MVERSFPILEYDGASKAIIEPGEIIQPIDIPQRCVLCFFMDVLESVAQQADVSEITTLGSEMGSRSVWRVPFEETELAVVHPGLGAPFAAATLEELIALGCRQFIVCGGAGVLNRDVVAGHPVVLSSAVRDEGTSYHYLPPGRVASASSEGVAALEATLTKAGIPYTTSKAWTTDAFYRETPARVARRRDEGCLVVEMEASALFAVAQFRGVTLGQVVYGGDDVSGAIWDSRRWQKRSSTRERLFWLAMEACAAL